MPADDLVLIVEDDPDLRDVLSSFLTEEGYRVVTAADGLDALGAAEHERPTLVLLDMRMPRMNGWEFAAELTRRCPYQRPAIVAVTAAENARKWAHEIGAAAYLGKPFELDEVLRTVARFASRSGPAGPAGDRPRGPASWPA